MRVPVQIASTLFKSTAGSERNFLTCFSYFCCRRCHMSTNVDITESPDHQHTHKKGTAVKSSSKPRIRPASVSLLFYQHSVELFSC